MSTPAPYKILIVDDEAVIADVLRLHLEALGYTTAWAADGLAALQLIPQCFDLILLDIRLPKLAGTEVLQEIRNSGCDAAVIMMTAYGTEATAVACMKNGAVDYFSKPFDFDEMMQRVKRALDTRQIQKENARLIKEKEEFFYMMSHDLKNPITAALGSVDIVREGRLGPVSREQEEFLQSAIDSCREMVVMIDNILDMRRFELGKLNVLARPCSLADLMSRAVSGYERAIQYAGITLKVENDQQLPEVVLDSNLMHRVLINLLANAVKFTPVEGEISLFSAGISGIGGVNVPERVAVPELLSNCPCLALIRISDSGSGIPPEDLDRVFERYTQSGGASTRDKGGAGLGLAFCRHVVETFGGIIWAESDGIQGSAFSILLPCSSCETTGNGDGHGGDV